MSSKHLVARGAGLVWLLTAVVSLPARGQTSYFSSTGTFTVPTGASQRIALNFSDTADTTFRTLAWNGGTNAAGNTIPANGIDSVLTFADGEEFFYLNDNLAPGNFDSLLTPSGSEGTLMPPLGPTVGTLTLSNNASPNALHWAVEMTRSGGYMMSRSAGTNSLVSSFTWGGSSPGIARVRLGIPASLVTTGPVAGRAGSSFELVFGGRLTAGTDFSLAGTGTISAGTLTVGGIEYCNGQMLQSGGFNTSHKIIVGHTASESGTFRLSGGTLNTNFADIGRFGTGTFTQDGGHANVSSNMLVAYAPGSVGRYVLDGGSLTLGALENGWDGQASFVQSGGAASINTVLIARSPNGTGYFALNSGPLATNLTVVGERGPGTFEQTSGNHDVGALVLGQSQSGIGTYILNSGPLTVAGDIKLGDLGTGKMNHFGGSTWATGNVSLGAQSGSSGAYTLNAGTLVCNLLKPGFNGTGTFVHNAGHVSPNEIIIGEGASAIGRYILANTGSILTNNVYVAVAGQGTMTQTGGIMDVTGLFTLVGRDAGSLGRYEQSGGFHQTRDLFLGYFPGSRGVYELSTGQLITSGSAFIGNEGTGTFLQSGGEFNPQNLSVGSAPTSAGSYDLSGGTLKVTQRMRVNPTGTVNFSGGRLEVGTLDIRGGARVLLSGGGDKVVRAGALEMYGSGRLDLSDNAAIIDYSGTSPLAAIQNLLDIGYNNGGWNAVGIISSTAAANAGHALGYAEASSIFSSFPAQFAGQFVDNSSILIRYTRYGDADLSGNVNLTDFNRQAANFGSTSALWNQGDFNYDNMVNLADFNLLAANFGLTASPAGPTPGDWSALTAAVPEPACALPAVAAFWGLRRRYRRRA